MAIPIINVAINNVQTEVIDVYGDASLVIPTSWLSDVDNRFMDQVDAAAATEDFANFGAAFDGHKLSIGRTALSLYESVLINPVSYGVLLAKVAASRNTGEAILSLQEAVADLTTRVEALEAP